MKHRIVIAAFLSAQIMTCVRAGAANEIKVEIRNRASPLPCNGAVTHLTFDAGAAISITIAPCTEEVRVYSLSGSHDIGRITINGSGSPLLKVFLGNSTFPIVDGNLDEVGDDFGGLLVSDFGQEANTVFAGAIDGHLTGSIRCGGLFRFEAGGEIRAEIQADTAHDDNFTVIASRITTSGRAICNDDSTISLIEVSGDIEGYIQSVEGSIAAVRTTTSTGDLLAAISAEEGEIGVIEIGGNIGSASNTVNITAGQDLGDGNTYSITKIQAQSVWANIVADDADRGDIREVITSAGNFTGSLHAFSAQGAPTGSANIQIEGDLDGDLIFDGDVKQQIWIKGSMIEGSTISIGHDLKNDPTEAFEILIDDADGLKGQIIINAGNGVSDPGEWLGAIRVGSTTLATAPYYSNLPSAIGGGAVGLAPYRIHDTACAPPHTAIVDLGETTLTQVKVRFYGPLQSVPGGDEPVEIHAKNYNTIPEGDWIDVTEDFDIAVNGREVIVAPKSGHSWAAPMQYRVRPVSGELTCAGVAGSPDVAEDEYILYFTQSEGEG